MTNAKSADPAYHGAVLVIFTGLLTLLLAGLLALVAGGNPAPVNDPQYTAEGPTDPPFTAAILWLELARTKAEVFQNLGDPADPAGQELRGQLDRMNYADYLFMFAYSGLNAALFLLVHGLNRRTRRNFFGDPRFFNFGLGLAVFMLVSDAVENVPQIMLTGYGSPAEIPDGVMLALALATHAKWGALWLACLALGMGLAAYFGARPALLLALPFSMAGVLGVMSHIVPGALSLLEMATNLMTLGWLGSLVLAFVIFRRGPKNEAATSS